MLFSSVTQSCPTLCDPMNCSTPGLPVHHQLPESTQTHVHGVGDAIQPSHPLLFPSPPGLNPSQHQGLFKWVSSSHEVAKLLEFQLQHQSFSEHPGLISFRMAWLDLLAVQGTLKSLMGQRTCSDVWKTTRLHVYRHMGLPDNRALSLFPFSPSPSLFPSFFLYHPPRKTQYITVDLEPLCTSIG